MLTNTTFWVLILVCFSGYFLFRFGMVSRGARKAQIEFLGGVTIVISFLLILILIGWKALLVQVGAFWIVITPLVEIIISALQKESHNPVEMHKPSKKLSPKGQQALIEYMRKIGQIRE